MHDTAAPGTLYVVATPIGNLEDITFRAKRILTEVALIACEDTRHTRKLLNHLDIHTKQTSYYREKEQLKTEILIKKLLDGQSIALVSDAGTPALSDPGSVLVRQCRDNGIPVVPVPGPSALAAAISASGMDNQGFFFGGFPPGKKSARRTFFQKLAHLPCPLVFYESPHRIKASLHDCVDIFGPRKAILFKELTKIHEKSFEEPLDQLLKIVEDGIRGELVIIIHGAPEEVDNKPDNLEELLLWYREQPDISLKEAVRCIAADLDLPRNMVYQKALSVWEKK